MNEKFSMSLPTSQTKNDQAFSQGMERFFQQSLGSNMDKLRNFSKFVPRQSLSNFIAKHELFRHILTIHGHIIECGVFLGGGLMTWGQLSAIYEPVNHVRRVVGFDTFSGFPKIGDEDNGENPEYAVSGGLSTNAYDDIKEAIRLYDLNRPVGHIPRIELVVGDATKTIPQYVQNNPHLVVAMLYLDFDLFDPTRIAIEMLLPRMPKGAMIVFDELNQSAWPGETLAVLETVGLRNLRIQRFPYMPQLSYAILD